MAAEVSWWTRAKKEDTEDHPRMHLTSLADLDQPNGTGSTRPPEGDATQTPKRVTFADGGGDDGAPRAANDDALVDDAVASFVDDALGQRASDTGAEESKAPGFVPSEAPPYVTAEQELYRRALDESARLERREEERDRRRPRGCLSNPVGWCLDATSPL